MGYLVYSQQASKREARGLEQGMCPWKQGVGCAGGRGREERGREDNLLLVVMVEGAGGQGMQMTCGHWKMQGLLEPSAEPTH